MNNFGCTTVIDEEANVEIITSYWLCFSYEANNPGFGFSFPCDENGNVDPDLIPCAKENYDKCESGEIKTERRYVAKSVRRHRLCSCGSLKYPEDVYDARGIFVERVCDQCRNDKLGKFRSDIFTDSNYYHDEPISEDHWDY